MEEKRGPGARSKKFGAKSWALNSYLLLDGSGSQSGPVWHGIIGVSVN